MDIEFLVQMRQPDKYGSMRNDVVKKKKRMGQRDLANCEIIMEQLILKVLLLLENDGNYNGGNVCLNHCG